MNAAWPVCSGRPPAAERALGSAKCESCTLLPAVSPHAGLRCCRGRCRLQAFFPGRARLPAGCLQEYDLQVRLYAAQGKTTFGRKPCAAGTARLDALIEARNRHGWPRDCLGTSISQEAKQERTGCTWPGLKAVRKRGV